MRPNSKNLALRDPALAAFCGILTGADFGVLPSSDANFGAEFGDDYGGEDDYGAEFGDDWGTEDADMAAAFGAAPSPRPSPVRQVFPAKRGGPVTAAAAAKWAAQSRTAARARLLEPNKGSAVKIERYSFSINQDITLGVPVALNMSSQPDTTIRPQRVSMNAPSPGFATVTEIKVANLSVTVGGIGDAFEYNANGVGQSLDMPTLSPASRASVRGNYTGFTPPGFVPASAYLFVASFKGPASIVA